MMEKAYQMGASEQGVYKVARQGVLNGLTYTPKPACRALASVAAVFRDGVRPVKDARFSVRREGNESDPKAGDGRPEAVRRLTFARNRTPYHVYFMPSDPQRRWSDKEARTTLKLPHHDDLDDLRIPVLVNLLTGDVFALPERKDAAEGGALLLDGLPLCDAPLLVCDLGALELR